MGQEEKKRYSDVELAEFKDIIIKKLDLAQRDYRELMNSLGKKGEMGTDDTAPTYKIMEEGYATQNKEEISSLAARQMKYIKNLQAALGRIENKTYGICRVTGKLIPKERLKAAPHATLSIENKLNKNH